VRGGEDAREARRGAACGEAPRPCRWTSEAVSLDNFGGMRSSLRGARVGARVSKTGPGKSWGMEG
jgi:hypothetical protein